jgi:hypothetical protein
MMMSVELRDAYYWVENAGHIEEFLDMSAVDAEAFITDTLGDFAQASMDEWAEAIVTREHLVALRTFLLLRRDVEDSIAQQDDRENEMDNPFFEER